MRRYTKYRNLEEAANKLEGMSILPFSEDKEEFISRFIRKNGEVVSTLSDCIFHNIDWLYGYLKANGNAASCWLMKMIEINRPSMAVDNFQLSADTIFLPAEQ